MNALWAPDFKRDGYYLQHRTTTKRLDSVIRHAAAGSPAHYTSRREMAKLDPSQQKQHKKE